MRAVITELERGLAPTRPQFLKWICDKLSALPSQNANAVNAALWSDNVCDVCEGYPEDLLQSACLELLKTRTFRPSPSEIVKVIEARHSERLRMLARAKRLLPETAKPVVAPAFTPEPEEDRLRATVQRFLDRKGGSLLGAVLQRSAITAEKRLAEIEGRSVAAWVNDAAIEASGGERAPDMKLPQLSPATRAATFRSVAKRQRAIGNVRYAEHLERQADALVPPERIDEPMGDEHEAEQGVAA